MPAKDESASVDQTGRSLLPVLIGGASASVVASGVWVWWAQRRKKR
jgi:hypothetical protein